MFCCICAGLFEEYVKTDVTCVFFDILCSRQTDLELGTVRPLELILAWGTVLGWPP